MGLFMAHGTKSAPLLSIPCFNFSPPRASLSSQYSRTLIPPPRRPPPPPPPHSALSPTAAAPHHHPTPVTLVRSAPARPRPRCPDPAPPPSPARANAGLRRAGLGRRRPLQQQRRRLPGESPPARPRHPPWSSRSRPKPPPHAPSSLFLGTGLGPRRSLPLSPSSSRSNGRGHESGTTRHQPLLPSSGPPSSLPPSPLLSTSAYLCLFLSIGGIRESCCSALK